MKYLCLAYGNEEHMKSLTKAQFEGLVEKCKVHDEELRRTGQVVLTESLEWATTTIRSRGGKVVVTDGPFVETKELIGGYAIFELRDEEEAVAAAREFMQLHLEHMPGWDGTCEVRALATPGVDGACEVNMRAHA